MRPFQTPLGKLKKHSEQSEMPVCILVELTFYELIRFCEKFEELAAAPLIFFLNAYVSFCVFSLSWNFCFERCFDVKFAVIMFKSTLSECADA